MKSFDDNLESLDVAPRFLDLSALAQLRRDSNTNRPKKDSSCIFLEKRERLESGDFLVVSHEQTFKKDYSLNFHQHNPNEKSELWNNMSQNLQEPTINGVDVNMAQINNTNAKLIEEESVIDHHLTIEKLDKLNTVISEQPQESLTKDDSAKEDPRFVIRVKKTDVKITLSAPDSEMCIMDDVLELDDIPEDMAEDRGNNMIFADEPTRLKAKVFKVIYYWDKSSLLIPNVFRALRLHDEDCDNYLEFQDYSRKELLVQSNGTKFKSGSSKDKNRSAKKIKKMSSGISEKMGRN